MAKSHKLEQLLGLLSQLKEHPTTDELLESLRQILTSKQSVAIAQAAKLVGQSGIAQLIPELAIAFQRLMKKPVETDPGCLAKKEIAEALYRLEYSEASLFLDGIHHVQMEPVWGGQVDKAPSLRGVCALGLVRMNYPHVMLELADLLADPELEARIAAARAIAYTGNPEAAPLLRLRVSVGDQPPVISECLMALLKFAPESSLPLVTRCLYGQLDVISDSDRPQWAEVAALALADSRMPEAMPLLQTWWAQLKDAELRQTALLAIAMMRNDTAIEFLLTLIAEGISRDAKGAIQALSIYQSDATLWQRVKKTAEQRGDEAIATAVDKVV